MAEENTYWEDMNTDVRTRWERAPDSLVYVVNAQRLGSPQEMEIFVEWFRELTEDFIELRQSGQMHTETEDAALEAIEEMLNLRNVDHGRYIRYMIRVRRSIYANGQWADWPCDTNGVETTDEEDAFEFDDHDAIGGRSGNNTGGI